MFRDARLTDIDTVSLEGSITASVTPSFIENVAQRAYIAGTVPITNFPVPMSWYAHILDNAEVQRCHVHVCVYIGVYNVINVLR